MRSILTPPHIRVLLHCLLRGAECVWVFPRPFHVCASFSAPVEPRHARRLGCCFPERQSSRFHSAKSRPLLYRLPQMPTDCWFHQTQKTTRTMHVAICFERLVVGECATVFEFHPYLRVSHEEMAGAPDSGWVHSKGGIALALIEICIVKLELTTCLLAIGGARSAISQPYLTKPGLYLGWILGHDSLKDLNVSSLRSSYSANEFHVVCQTNVERWLMWTMDRKDNELCTNERKILEATKSCWVAKKETVPAFFASTSLISSHLVFKGAIIIWGHVWAGEWWGSEAGSPDWAMAHNFKSNSRLFWLQW